MHWGESERVSALPRAIALLVDPRYCSFALTATVAPEFGGTPTGTLVFKDGSTMLKSETLSGGSASYASSKLAKGTRYGLAESGGIL
jgi:hypothetical protein